MLRDGPKAPPEERRRSFLEYSQGTVNDPFVQSRLKAVFSGEKYFDAPDGRRFELTPLGIFNLLPSDALCYAYLGRKEEAKRIYLKAFEAGRMHLESLIQRKVDIEHPPTFAEDLFQLALYAALAGDGTVSCKFFSEAENYYQRAIDYWKKFRTKRKDPEEVGYCRLYRAYCLIRTGLFQEALKDGQVAEIFIPNAKPKSNLRMACHRYLPGALKSLCNYKLSPNEASLKQARDSLHDYKQKLDTKGFATTGYPLIYDLQQAFSDVYEPVLP